MSELQISFVNVAENPFLERYVHAKIAQALEGVDGFEIAIQVALLEDRSGSLALCDLFTVTGEVLHSEASGPDMAKTVDSMAEALAAKVDARFRRKRRLKAGKLAAVLPMDAHRSRAGGASARDLRA